MQTKTEKRVKPSIMHTLQRAYTARDKETTKRDSYKQTTPLQQTLFNLSSAVSQTETADKQHEGY